MDDVDCGGVGVGVDDAADGVDAETEAHLLTVGSSKTAQSK